MGIGTLEAAQRSEPQWKVACRGTQLNSEGAHSRGQPQLTRVIDQRACVASIVESEQVPRAVENQGVFATVDTTHRQLGAYPTLRTGPLDADGGAHAMGVGNDLAIDVQNGLQYLGVQRKWSDHHAETEIALKEEGLADAVGVLEALQGPAIDDAPSVGHTSAPGNGIGIHVLGQATVEECLHGSIRAQDPREIVQADVASGAAVERITPRQQSSAGAGAQS